MSRTFLNSANKRYLIYELKKPPLYFLRYNNLDIRTLKKSCVHIAQADGKLIPFEAFNLFYRGERAVITESIRQEISTWTKQRHLVAEKND